jgi:hypothetical protein
MTRRKIDPAAGRTGRNTFLRERRFLLWTLGVPLLLCGVIMGTNWLVDPLWCFRHHVPFGQWQAMFNERVQKANILVFRRPAIGTLVLGSSRMMYTDPAIWGPDGFNYAANSMVPAEYAPALRNVGRTVGMPERIVAGFDFLGASIRREQEVAPRSVDTLRHVDEALASLYRVTALLDYNVFRHAVRNILRRGFEAKDGTIRYDGGPRPDLHLEFRTPDDGARREMLEDALEIFGRSYGAFLYDERHREKLREFRREAGDATVIPFTTPEGTPFLRIIAETQGLLDSYERWIRDLVDVFGGVWNFMDVNRVTSDPYLYREPSHFGPKVSGWIADRILERGDPPKDFGILVTPWNVDEHLRDVRARIERLKTARGAWDAVLSPDLWR